MTAVPLSTVVDYEKEYEEQVTLALKEFAQNNKLPNMHQTVMEKREILSTKFWDSKRLIVDITILMVIMKIMKCHRRNTVVKTLIKMGFNRDGTPNNRSWYYDESPLFSKGEMESKEKEDNVCEFAWVIHRDVAKWLPYFTREVCAVEAQTRLYELFPRIVAYKEKHKKNPHIDRVHNGFALGSTVTGGGKYGCRERNISGSVHWANFFNKDLDLEREFFQALTDMVVTAFGHCEWFQRLNHFLRNHENTCFADRLIPGTPFTCIWLTWITREFNIHEDERNLFVGFLCVPDYWKGGDLVISDPDYKVFRSYHLDRGDLIAGRCFQASHCNLTVLEERPRMSLAMYFDFRIPSSRFVRKAPVRALNYF